MNPITKVVFVRVGWMNYYGALPEQGKPIGGGSHNLEKVGGESLNFSIEPDGCIRGYVYIKATGGGFNLKRICERANKDTKTCENVMVISVARDPHVGRQCIVGWYKNATVHASIQKKQRVWVFEADPSDCVLIPPKKRTFEIPGGKGGFGQSNVCYTRDSSGREKQSSWMEEAAQYVQKYSRKNALDWVIPTDLSLKTYEHVHVANSNDGWRQQLEQLLRHWIECLKRAAGDDMLLGSYTPFCYNERVHVSFLAAASWQMGSYALEEFRTRKGEEKVSGRGDIMIRLGDTMTCWEAKVSRTNVEKKPSFWERVLRRLEKARDDAEQNELTHADRLKKIGVVFACPSIQGAQIKDFSRCRNKLVEDLEELRQTGRFPNVDFDGQSGNVDFWAALLPGETEWCKYADAPWKAWPGVVLLGSTLD